MTNQPVNISPVLADKQLQAAIEYLDEDDTVRDSFWYELGFMEKHGFDIAFYEGRIDYLLNRSESPVYKKGGLSAEILRRIALQLRDVIRREQGLPPLSDAEKRVWRFEMPYDWKDIRLPYVEDRTSVEIIDPNLEDGIGSPFTDEQITAAIDYVKTYYPEIVRYMAVVKHDRATYKPTPENENKHSIRMSVVRLYMANAIFYCLQPSQTLNFRGDTHRDWKIYNIIYDSL
jgi:hypothetical protein